MLQIEKSREEELNLCYRVWDLRRERVRDEHKLEMAVTKHFVEIEGHVGNESHHMDRELNSFRRMVETEAKVTESYSALCIKREQILRLERGIQTIDRVLQA
ncbi:hypothetical protein KC19_VG297300 [Ceratodon purpureus]|uniref:Uncharacterized protein n=1 Tax=Ceratodon purpureus TaxID=3225 RepID=A0A8T0HVZ1_CERPU|nr:hypothetical protein KC19_VG297300 [Ceratodon purpureus]